MPDVDLPKAEHVLSVLRQARLSRNETLSSQAKLREQVRPGLRERHVSAGRMHGEPAVRDGGFPRPVWVSFSDFEPRPSQVR